MDIKIPEGPPEGAAIDAVNGQAEAVEATQGSAGIEQVATLETEAIARIAEQVVSGEISRDEAVQQILNEAINTDLIQGAPNEIKEDLIEALRALIETDPHLLSLASSSGPRKTS